MTTDGDRGKIGGIPSAAILFGILALLAILLLGWNLLQSAAPVPSSSLEITGQQTQLFVSSNANIRDRPTSKGSQIIGTLVPGDVVDGVVEQGEVAGFFWLKLTNGAGYVSIVNLAVNTQASAVNSEAADAANAAADAASVAAAAAATASFTDASEFCGAVGTADGPPDARYTGPERVQWIERAIGFNQDYGYVEWGCDKGSVVACVNNGITGPCAKVDSDRNPHSGLIEFCNANPNSDVPAAASGHYTAFDWYCKAGSPTIRRQFMSPDHRGYVPNDYRVVTKS